MIWGLDTETDNDGRKAWVVQWCITGEKGTYTGTDVRALTHKLRKLGRSGEKQYIYIHNLKYDLEFIKYCLWDLYQHYDAVINPIFRNGQPIQVTVEVNNRMLIFRDSMKKWQGSLRSLGEAINLPKLENVDPEFTPGWSRAVDFDDPQVWEYIKRDQKICSVAGEFWHKNGHRRATTSGDAWSDMKRTIGTKYWDEQFPCLTREEDDELRDGYFGGINISRFPGYHEGPITHEDKVSMYPGVMLQKPLPVGSPVYMGAVKPESGLWVGRLKVKMKIRENHIPWFTFKNGIDYCDEKLEYGEHVTETRHWHTLTLTCVDWYNLNEDYEIVIDTAHAKFWAFRSRTGLMKPYIDKWAKEKKTAKKGSAEREHAKRMLNAAYGRFALIPDGMKTELVMDPIEHDLVWRSEQEDGDPSAYLPYAMFTTAWQRRELMDRVRLVTEERGIEAVLHCDTDSVIYRGEPIGGYGSDIGQWALESQPSGIYEGGFKRYIEVFEDQPFYIEQDGKVKITRYNIVCAGVPQPVRGDGLPYGMWIELLDHPKKIFGGVLGKKDYIITSDWLQDLYDSKDKDWTSVNTLKLLPRKVPGGVILEGKTHEIDHDGLSVRLSRQL